jgi:Leucine-rich repeat (LRR) protein
MSKNIRFVILVFSFLLMLSQKIIAQVLSNGSEIPIFKTKNDSVKYYLIRAQMKAAFEAIPVDGKKADSLSGEFMVILRTGVSGYKKEYRADPLLFPYGKLYTTTNFDTIRSLSVSNVRSRRLPKGIRQCKNLETLELVNTKINRLGKLKSLSKLKEVRIYNNQSSIQLSKSKSIKKLVIRSQTEIYLPKTFHRLKTLENLDLAETALTQFPKGVVRNKKLKELILNNNSITLTEGITPIPSLENLYLTKNKIQRIPSAIGEFTNLKKLTFNFNEIEKVADEISKLQKLEELSFYNNKLKSIPEGVYKLPSVRAIDLYYNQIERLEPKLSAWKKLDILYLAFNQLISLPDDFSALTSLQELYLHNNRLSFIPEGIGELPKLKVLRINNNYISNLPEALMQLRSLENLDLSRNKIESLLNDFSQFDHLKILSLVSNPWNKETKDSLLGVTEKLRARSVIVHLNSFEESTENK